ncbi:MAG: hypothetical protein IKY06_09200 [Clostridia bacterium]|nr:hypothetical protein [Clostridia bacterium]
MFQNSGNKIKTLALILFVICLIATLILAITASIIRDYYGNADGFRFWQFLGILVGGSITSFISSLFLYAFGDLVEDVSILRSYVLSIKNKLSQTDASAQTAHPTEGYYQQLQKENTEGRLFPKDSKTGNDRCCPNCGLTIHAPQIHTCPRCGTHVE